MKQYQIISFRLEILSIFTTQTHLLQAECAKLREVLFSKEERLSAEAASNLRLSAEAASNVQEIIMLNEDLGRLKVSLCFCLPACLCSGEFARI